MDVFSGRQKFQWKRMAHHTGKNSNVFWSWHNWRRSSKCRITWPWKFSLRIFICWVNAMRRFNRSVGGSQAGLGEMMQRQVAEARSEIIICRSKLRKWAYENAITLVFMAIGFAITWAVMILYGIKHAT